MVAKKVTGDTKKKVAPKKKVVVKKVAPKKVISNVAQEIENPKTETVMEKKIKFNKVYVIFGVALLILIVVFYLLGNGNKSKNVEISPTSNSLNLNQNNSTTTSTPVGDTVQNGNTVKVDYVGRLEDGTIFDSSIEEFAKKMKNYDPASGRKYEPLEFQVGAGNMIKGFDTGVVGMKLGEKKTLTIAPADAYGEKTIIQEVPLSNLQDIITQEVEKKNFEDKITQEVPVEMLGEKGKNLKVGEEIDISGVKGTVKSLNGTGVTLEIVNDQNPFYGKKLVVGLEGEYQGNKLTIKKIDDTNVTLEIQNKQNPFYGKKLIVGLEGTLPNGQKVKITEISSESVKVEMNNPHELAGKTLIFDVEIKEIK
ncbi:FKBP-type peptidyl-prolyl cis-trans isomerase [Candidatus Gracilibacteria bacterium]|nr:FKBP-type peptidyl-prolyl cis-trans isomerase [Candidatus Gracilibacteria bacterium]